MTSGIHHITAIASNAKNNLHFYTKILGLRLVKKTVNQDDIGTYHLFFGDDQGHPGMDLTFFIFLPSDQGHRGAGLVTTISLVVPEGALSYWLERFNKYGVKHDEVETRFSQQRLTFYDADDQRLELVEVVANELDTTHQPWTTEIPADYAIRYFHSARLSVLSHSMIEPILSHVFGYTKIATENNINLYRVANSKRAHLIEVAEEPDGSFGYNAAGTVHHIAFRAKDDTEQLQLQQKVKEMGLYTSEVINRYYFKAVYFRTPAGILFEISTDQPGFTTDEDAAHLGEKLALPPFLEPRRAEIESQIIPLP